MKKKMIIFIFVVSIILLGWIGYEIYAYYNPEFGFRTAIPDGKTDMYIEHLNFYINEKSIFGVPKDIYEKSSSIVDGSYELYKKIIDRYTAPLHVSVIITEEDGKTMVTYEGMGTVKENGKEEVIREEIRFDYIVGK